MTNKNNQKTRTKTKEWLTASELAEKVGTRYGTIKFYSELGILPFRQEGERARRYYHQKEAIKRFQAIRKLKEKRLAIKEIVKYFKNK